MQVSDYIRNTISRLPISYVFTYRDFNPDVNDREAIIKALNRMVAKGEIAKLSKGKYYKPKETSFGLVPPDQYQVVKDLLGKGDNLTGYLTGYSIYTKLGLTTQVSNTIQIGRNETRPTLQRGLYKISFVKQKNTITEKNIPFLQILDAIRFIKKIPDTTIDDACKRLFEIVKNSNESDQIQMIRLAKKYPPATRAFLGAMLERVLGNRAVEPLSKSLNPITKYKIGVSSTCLPNATKWNIL
ncbi:hypothetical protein L21SP5_01076 [Salinivirga cyanobacteriivorans]|uniref:AbiEi antitoxin C-terminal domain-containing protein n=1 Tax=Salinivirga cyanobacteriivorans TaxID=1307839 RepID=A0A0S2HXN6_9BACT|nr:DUF6088 family protein [Salinivirga cyanobacteriivorans]ALO14740.1 hypothetical protein L21SP5_01076 [Salinivirga cyanobacteriivorans]